MPDILISQFARSFSQPIETNRLVSTLTVRDNIPVNVRWEGMIVYVITEGESYVLKGGIDNTDWTLIEGLSDAPIDGSFYARKDGNWEIITQEFSGIAATATNLLTDTDSDGIRTSFPFVSYTIQASSMGTNGDIFRTTLDGTINPGAGLSEYEIRIGGVVLGNILNVSGAGLRRYRIEIDMIRRTPTTALFAVKTYYSGSGMTYNQYLATVTFGSAISYQYRIDATDAGATSEVKTFTGQFLNS
jgi:hypothetical protein